MGSQAYGGTAAVGRQPRELAMFGGWQTHSDRLDEVAWAFLTKARFRNEDIFWSEDVQSKRAKQKKTLLEVATECIRSSRTLAGKKAKDDIPWLGSDDALPKITIFDESVAVASSHPWMLADGGGDRKSVV